MQWWYLPDLLAAKLLLLTRRESRRGKAVERLTLCKHICRSTALALLVGLHSTDFSATLSLPLSHLVSSSDSTARRSGKHHHLTLCPVMVCHSYCREVPAFLALCDLSQQYLYKIFMCLKDRIMQSRRYMYI